MAVIDLTFEVSPERLPEGLAVTRIPLRSADAEYTGMVYDLSLNSMDGSYLDLPGHVLETDDGRHGGNTPAADFYRVPCSAVHLHKGNRAGAVTAQELETAFGGRPATPALLVNALGPLDPRDIEERTVWLDHGALDWIIGSGVRLLVSDIYESRALHGVFPKLFRAGVCAVCEPRGMWRIQCREFLLTVAFLKIAGMTQLPCRIIAETPESED